MLSVGIYCLPNHIATADIAEYSKEHTTIQVFGFTFNIFLYKNKLQAIIEKYLIIATGKVAPWQHDKEQGKGKHISAEGWTYDGEWESGLRKGQGKYVYKNGSTYEGAWKNNKENGLGTHVDVSGWTYTGEWKDGLKHGKGKIVYKDTSYYDGDWENNVRHGKGTQTYFDDQGKYFGIYVGDFASDKRNGQGKFTYANEYVQSGLWKNDNFME